MQRRRWQVLAGLAGTALAAAALRRAGPQLQGTGGMDSDEAIPQLMANAHWWNPFSLYFWGQDRLGGWPYGIEWALHRVFGFGWSYRGLYAVLAVGLLSALWPLRRIGGWWGWVAASAVLALLAVHETTRHWLLSIGQPYAWQMASFFWAWWMLRRLAMTEHDGVIPLWQVRSPRWRRFVLPAALASLLSIWSSPLSALFLWIAGLTETVRIPAGRRAPRLWLRLCGVVVLAILAELVIRIVDQRYAAFRHWRIYWTDARWDRGHVIENIVAYGHQLRLDPLTPVTVLSAVTLAVGVGILATRNREPREAVDNLLVAAACSAMAWINVLVTVLSSWGRINGYTPRYLTPSWILWTVSSVAMVATLIELWPEALRRFARAGTQAAAGVVLLAAALWTPLGEHSAAAADRMRIAAELPRLEPDGVVLGCYWGTYSAVDGGVPHALTPIVHHRDMQRTPWTGARLKEVQEVVVAHERCPPLGPPEHATPYVFEQGVLLALRTPHWLKEGSITLSLYDNRSAWLIDDAVSRGSVPPRLTSDAPLPLTPSAKGQEAFSVRLPRPGTHLLLFFSSRVSLYLTTPGLRAELVRADGSTAPLQVISGEHYVSVAVSGLEKSASVRLINMADPVPESRLDAVAIEP